MTIPIVDEILEALPTVTDDELRRSASKLDTPKKNDKRLGPVDQEVTRRLLALSWRWAYEAVTLKHKATFEADSDLDKKEMLAKSVRLHSMSRIASFLYIHNAIHEVGYDALEADTKDNVQLHLCTGFMLCALKTPSHFETLRAIGLPIRPEEDQEEE